MCPIVSVCNSTRNHSTQCVMTYSVHSLVICCDDVNIGLCVNNLSALPPATRDSFVVVVIPIGVIMPSKQLTNPHPSTSQDTGESTAKFRIENRVNNGVKGGIGVA